MTPAKTLSENEIRARVVEVIKGTAAVASSDITANTDLVLDLAFDSLRLAELATRLEEAFGTEFLLPEWVEEAGGRHSLTVGSLWSFTTRAVQNGGPQNADQ